MHTEKRLAKSRDAVGCYTRTALSKRADSEHAKEKAEQTQGHHVHIAEEVCTTMLPLEVFRHDILVVGKVR